MRKFDDQDVQETNSGDSGPVLRLVVPSPPAFPRSTGDERLTALVDFAIGRGYYEHWNGAAGPGETDCKSKDLPTDNGGDSN
jgi:hypothetical protein